MALILREKDVRSLLSMSETISVLEQAFIELAAEAAVNNPRTRIIMPQGVLHILAAAVPALGAIGVKTYTSFVEGFRYVVLLFSTENGQLLALIEADWLGSMRTGGTSALATQYLARHDASTVGLIGAGNQAVTQLMGIREVRSLQTVRVYSRHERERVLFCDGMRKMLDLEVIPVATAREAVETADIVITATNSEDPVFYGEWLRPGCHINAIGSNWSNRRELDHAALERCTLIVTDSREQAEMEAGDLLIPAEKGLFQWENVIELADIVAKNEPGRTSADDITLYKGLGIGLEDIAVAAHVYSLAVQQHYGEQLDLLRDVPL